MSVQEGDAAPDFEMPASGGRTVSQHGAAGQAVRAVFLSEGRHARLHQGGLRVPGGAAATRQDRPRRDRRVARQDEADREVRREIRTDIPAGLGRGPCGGRGYGTWVEKSMYGRKYMGMERSTFLIDERRQGRQGLAQGEARRPCGRGAAGGARAEVAGTDVAGAAVAGTEAQLKWPLGDLPASPGVPPRTNVEENMARTAT